METFFYCPSCQGRGWVKSEADSVNLIMTCVEVPCQDCINAEDLSGGSERQSVESTVTDSRPTEGEAYLPPSQPDQHANMNNPVF